MNVYWLGTMLDNACILMFAALGDVVALTAGEYNMGGDGQIYAGAFTAAIVLNATTLYPSALSVVASLAAAICAVCLLALLSILLRVYRSVGILISSYLASAAAITIVDALIAGKYRGEGSLLATPFITSAVSAPRIMLPSSLSLAALAAPVLCIASWAYLKHSEGGKRLIIVGVAAHFADYAGLKSLRTSQAAVLFAYMMHALSGFVMVAGTHHACIAGFEEGIGWSAFTVALLARKNALSVIPCALILSAIMTLSSMYSLTHLTHFDASALIQGASIAIITVMMARRKR